MGDTITVEMKNEQNNTNAGASRKENQMNATMTNDPATVTPGGERIVRFRSRIHRGQMLYQWDYRSPAGELFSGVEQSVAEARRMIGKAQRGELAAA